MARTPHPIRFALLLACACTASFAQTAGTPASTQLVITRATADGLGGPSPTVTVDGLNFGTTPSTKVLLGTTAGLLQELSVISRTPTQIVASLGTSTAGTYVLKVSSGTASAQNFSIDLTLGAVGPQGPQGPQGATGAVGPAGAAGAPGEAGPAGPAGPAGLPGATGAVGPQGPQGPIGLTGPAGPQGAQGPQGPSGPSGAAGATGPEGPQGPIGLTGPAGPTGPQGATGAQGPAGPAGPQGPAGTNGVDGEGFSYRGPWVVATYLLNDVVTFNGSAYVALIPGPSTLPPSSDPGRWQVFAAGGSPGATGATGAQGPQGSQGPVGPAGPAGPSGPQGLAATVSVAGTATGLPGSNASVVNIGSPSAAVLQFNIPRGDTGAPGPQGLQGPQGPQGPQGVQGPPGPNSVVGNLSLDPSVSSTQGNILKGGNRFLHTYGPANLFLGDLAGNFTLTGQQNIGVGLLALNALISGADNTALGANTLRNNSTGNSNTAVGSGALRTNTTSNGNTAIGMGCLQNSTGGFNTGIGTLALSNVTTGIRNVAIGPFAGQNIGNGNDNIYIGYGVGGLAEFSTIRIGAGLVAAYISGIHGATSPSGVAVYVDPAGKLGTTTSSRRYKEDISTMSDVTTALMQLRPVTFLYRREYDDGARILQYGLIAEEVDQVLPGLVARNPDGSIETVRYQFLAPMLLSQVQQQQRTIEAQAVELKQQAARIAALERQAGEVAELKKFAENLAAMMASRATD